MASAPIWSYLSFHLYSQYLRCPKREQSDPETRIQFDLRLDEIGRTSHSDCDRSILICRCAIANSRFEWFDRRMRSISMGIHDERMSYAHNPNGPTVWRCSDVSCNSRTVCGNVRLVKVTLDHFSCDWMMTGIGIKFTLILKSSPPETNNGCWLWKQMPRTGPSCSSNFSSNVHIR